MDILKIVESTMIDYKLVKSGELILVAVSGGPDSLAMLEILHQLQERFAYRLHVVHLNHQLRIEAESEAEFVREFANERSLPVTILQADISTIVARESGSLQDIAREVRYNLFNEVAEKICADKIAVGHHADDLAETVIMRFLRGSGLEGLIGFSAQSRGNLIRPLIRLTREEIEAFCHTEGLTPCYDISNTKPVYLRNQIRLQLIPQLEAEYNPNLRHQLVQLSHLLDEENSFIEDVALEEYRKALVKEESGLLIFKIHSLLTKKPVIIRRIIRLGMEKLKGDKKNLYYQHYLGMQELILNGSPGKMVHLPDGYLLYRGYKELKLGLTEHILNVTLQEHTLSIPGQVYLEELDLMIRAETISGQVMVKGDQVALDADLIGRELMIRSRKPGDWFYPLGLKGKKKVKDFLIDLKIDRLERDLIPIVTTNQGDILWIAGYRLDDRYKVTAKTERTCILTIYRSEDSTD